MANNTAPLEANQAGVLSPLATELTTLPIGTPHAGCTAGFAFEMFYALGNFVPWRESASALLLERTSLLADRCTIAAAGSQCTRRRSPGPETCHRARGTPGSDVPAALRSVEPRIARLAQGREI